MLSNTTIDRLKPGAKTKRISDRRDGLTLEMRPSGKKVFIFRFQWEHKPQTLTLGCYPSLSLAAARELAVGYRSCLHVGIDPREKFRATNADKILFKAVAECSYDVIMP